MDFAISIKVYWQLHTPQLIEQAVLRQEGCMVHLGYSLYGQSITPVAYQGTGSLSWSQQHAIESGGGDIIPPFSLKQFDSIKLKLSAYHRGKNAFLQNAFAGAAPKHRLAVCVISETAWHNLFTRNMFIRTAAGELVDFEPDFTVIHAPNFHTVPNLMAPIQLHLSRSISRRISSSSAAQATQEKSRSRTSAC